MSVAASQDATGDPDRVASAQRRPIVQHVETAAFQSIEHTHTGEPCRVQLQTEPSADGVTQRTPVEEHGASARDGRAHGPAPGSGELSSLKIGFVYAM